VVPADHRPQGPQQGLGHLLVGAQQPQQLRSGHDQEGGALDGLGRGRAGARVQQGQLAEDRRGVVAVELDQLPVPRAHHQLHRALQEHEHGLAGVVLPEHHLALVDHPPPGMLDHGQAGPLVQPPEGLDPAQQQGGRVGVHVLTA
jgi:hypothetical protein